VESAIDIAFSPVSDHTLKSQAYNFLEQLKSDVGGWQVCLTLFLRQPRPSEVVRHVSLEAINNALRTQQVDANGLEYIKDSLLNYAREHYGSAQAVADSASLQNKLTQIISSLFITIYATTWPTLIDDFRTLAGENETIGTTNTNGTILYLRILRSIHDEIADPFAPRSQDEGKRSAELKDLVRARDVAKITASWRAILSRWRQSNPDMIEMCLRCIGRWVSWIDITLVMAPEIMQCLWDLTSTETTTSGDSSVKNKLASIDALNEILSKKMNAGDKIRLIDYMNLSHVLAQLTASGQLSEYRGTSQYDTDLGEAVAKLTNSVLFDVVKVLDTDNIDSATRTMADSQLQEIMPFVLRFFSDEYDEICSSVIPALTDLLAMFRKRSKAGLAPHYSQMLQPLLDRVVSKMKYDETADWGAEDERTDEAEFQELRKRLHVLQQTIAATDENLYIETISKLVADTFGHASSGNSALTWRDLDLALHEMYLFGELAVKNGGLYSKNSPTSNASRRLIEMMKELVQSNLVSNSHPAVQLRYLEICVRYVAFFDHHEDLTRRTLENFIRFIHSEHPKIRTRSWYLFYKFIKQLRQQLGNDARTVMQSFGDLLEIKAELPDSTIEDDDSSDVNDRSPDAIFTAQLYLFEAIGCIASTPSISVDDQKFYAQGVLNPLVADLTRHLPQASSGDARALLQVHHIIMAIGTVAKGFCDWTPGQSTSSSSDTPVPKAISLEFNAASEAILAALEALKTSMEIRTAARFSFSRMLGVLGSQILQQLPRWIGGLLSQTSTRDEMATFLRLLDQIVYGFKTEIYSILDSLLSPLLDRVFAGLSEAANGTDDQIQLVELKTQYLNFILVILNNDLSSVMVSPINQNIFDPLISSIEHFCRDVNDCPTARLAFSTLTRMTIVWGGPDVTIPGSPQTLPSSALGNSGTSRNNSSSTTIPTTVNTPQPAFPGFDHFVISRFSPLVWTFSSTPSLDPKDAQARSALGEAAVLQWTILRKCGVDYETHLRGTELSGIGLVDDAANQYVMRIKTNDAKEWKKFFMAFVVQMRGGV